MNVQSKILYFRKTRVYSVISAKSDFVRLTVIGSTTVNIFLIPAIAANQNTFPDSKANQNKVPDLAAN